MVPGQALVDHCTGVVLEDQGSQMEVLHMDGEDQEDLVAQDTHLAVLELLFDKTFFKPQFHFFYVMSARRTTNEWQAVTRLVGWFAGWLG